MKIRTILLAIVITLSFSCAEKKAGTKPIVKPIVECNVTHPAWTKNAVIYEVNIRQHTPEGTFRAFIDEIPELKETGIDILWLMPVHPIGEKNRKGNLGSYYSVKDYEAINPEFGNMDDFKELVGVAHQNGMYVILDWVANHTSWDHKWIEEHPEWYDKDSTGNLISPFDWTDVAQLKHGAPGLSEAMINALKFWVQEADIDGFRCDVAGMVPTEFWVQARRSLDKIKPVFMLAEDEAEHELLSEAFDMNYGWEMHHLMNKLAKGEEKVSAVKEYFERQDSIYPKNCYRMNFLTNHDENSWAGTVFERLGGGVKTFAVMMFTIPGMPLLYSGQEVGSDRRLEFFEKDTIIRAENDFQDFYKSLITLKKSNALFWNGAAGGDFMFLDVKNEKVLAFKRYSAEKEVYIMLNLSGEEQNIEIPSEMSGTYKNYFDGKTWTVQTGEDQKLEAWGYLVLQE